MPSAECRRSWLYSSIHSTTARRASARVANEESRRSSNSSVECQDSITALSSAEPTRPIDCRTPSRAQAAWKAPAVYSLPWMLSCVSSRDLRVSRFGDWVGLAGVEQIVDLADEVAL